MLGSLVDGVTRKRDYFDAKTSTGLMCGGLTKSSDAFAMSASATLPDIGGHTSMMPLDSRT